MCKDICRISRIHIYFVEYADTQICLYRLTTIIRHLYFQRSLFTKYIIVLVQFDTDIQSLFRVNIYQTFRYGLHCTVKQCKFRNPLIWKFHCRNLYSQAILQLPFCHAADYSPHLPQQINVLFRHPFCLGNHKLHPFLIVLQ